jgi:hypothetical protein
VPSEASIAAILQHPSESAISLAVRRASPAARIRSATAFKFDFEQLAASSLNVHARLGTRTTNAKAAKMDTSHERRTSFSGIAGLPGIIGLKEPSTERLS